MEVLRTFVAIEVSPEISDRARGLIKQISGTSAKVHWTDPTKMHLTLNFLGNVPLNEIPAVCKHVVEAVGPLPAFDVEMATVGVFPSYNNPRTIWLGVEEGAEQLVELHQALVEKLSLLGFRPEGRRYRPHLTLGRVRTLPNGADELSDVLKKFATFEAGPMMIAEVTVLSSEMARGGPVYEPLGYAELLGKRSEVEEDDELEEDDIDESESDDGDQP